MGISSQSPINGIIKRRKFGCIDHILRRPCNIISRQALDWNSQRSRKLERSKIFWERSVEEKMEEEGKTWRGH